MDKPKPGPLGLANGEMKITFPACVVTKAAAQRVRDSQETEEPNGSGGRKDNQGDGATTLPPNDSISRVNSVDTIEASGSYAS